MTQTLPTVSKQFVTAGRAVMVAVSATGERYTFKVQKVHTARAKQHGWGPAFFARVKSTATATIGKNEGWAYIGTVEPNELKVKPTPASEVPPDDKRAKVLQFALDVVAGRKPLPAGYAVTHAGYCGRCQKELTVPESIMLGLGPVCAKVA